VWKERNAVPNVLSSKADKPSERFVQEKRGPGETNLAWFKRNLETLESEEDGEGAAFLVMVGGKEKSHFRLRVAQAQLRHDRSPSHYSHVALLRASGWARGGSLWEIALESKRGFGFPPEDNGVQTGSLSHYASTSQFPNLAVLRLPVKLSDMQSRLKVFKQQRGELDCVELMVLWLAYVWSVARAPNPLLDGHGTPGAAFIEALAAASGFDLTPGIESRASCPEAIWQAAKWWHKYYAAANQAPIRGMWHLEHFLG
jgi:hypothetical protein